MHADALQAFGTRLALAERYAELLAGDGVVRGLIGPREVPRLWDRHLLNCVAVAQAVPTGASVCDVGSGAGLPGLVLAIARPDVTVTLVEPLLRRTTFLQQVVDELGLARVRVHRGRADSLHGLAHFDVVTSRAVAPLGRLLEWSMPLVAPHGVLVAMKGSGAEAEVLESVSAASRLGCAPPEIHTLGSSVSLSTAIVVRVAWADPARVSSDPARNARTRDGRGRSRSKDRRPRS